MFPRIARTALLAAICAATSPLLGEAPRVHALTGARVVVAPGRVLPSATIVLRDGLIEALGPGLAPPADARVWDLSGKTVYPGLIDLYVPRAWPEPKDEKDAERAQGGDSNRLVRPERDMLEHARDEKGDQALRAAGVTTALVAPSELLFRGKSVLVDLGGGPLGANLLRRDVALHVAVRPPQERDDDRRYPGSTMGAVALFRQRIFDARWLRDAATAFRANASQARPASTSSLVALDAAAHGEQIVVFESRNLLDTLRALDLVDELGLRAWIVASGEEWKRLDRLARRPIPVVLPVPSAEPPKTADADDYTLGLDELRTWTDAPKAPAKFVAAKIPFALSAWQLKEPKDLHARLARAIENGLSSDQALASFTTLPAEWLGLSGRLGTIEPGKIANLVVADGDLFTKETRVRAVWIDGNRYEIEEKSEKGEKKGDGKNPSVEVER